MRQIQASEAKSRFLQLLDDVERGETLIITRHGQPVARLTSEADHRRDAVQRAKEEIRQLRPRFGKATPAELIADRDSGRKR